MILSSHFVARLVYCISMTRKKFEDNSSPKRHEKWGWGQSYELEEE